MSVWHDKNSKLFCYSNINYLIVFFQGILKFWLDLGVSGFQLRKTAFLVEDGKFQDEGVGTKPGSTHDSYDFFNHKHTSFLHESLGLVGQWRSLVTNASEAK